MSTASAPAPISASSRRLIRVRELWARSEKDQLEIGRLLHEERADKLGVGGRGDREGFHQWLREAGIPKTSAYRRIADYEESIGERKADNPFDKPAAKPVPIGTTSLISEVRHWSPDREKRKNRSTPPKDFEELRGLAVEMLIAGYKELRTTGKYDNSHLYAAKEWAQLSIADAEVVQ